MLRIGIDAMGGDFAPDAVVKGVVQAFDYLDAESRVVLFGDRRRLERLLKEENFTSDRLEIVATSEVITMEDHPAKAYQTKLDSSIRVGFRYLKEGRIDGFASAGSTGAMMVGVTFATGSIPNVIRPAISAAIANTTGGYTLILDVGLNVDCKPDVLHQYGLMGSIYAKSLWHLDNPRVALLNIGEERTKGNLATKAAYEIMEDTQLYNFVGNVEGKDFFTGRVADVVVCDGFMGNVLLKLSESLRYIAKARRIEDNFLDRLDYEIMSGTPVLGVNDVVIIGHGASSVYALKNMVLQTEKSIRSGYVDSLKNAFTNL